jgi:hypothetical protein
MCASQLWERRVGPSGGIHDQFAYVLEFRSRLSSQMVWKCHFRDFSTQIGSSSIDRCGQLMCAAELCDCRLSPVGANHDHFAYFLEFRSRLSTHMDGHTIAGNVTSGLSPEFRLDEVHAGLVEAT